MNKKERCNDMMSDIDIVLLVQEGKQDCFDILIKRYEQKLFYYVMRFVSNEDEAKDVVQNIFIKAHKYIDSFDTDKKFSSWIYRIAHNEALNFITRSRYRNDISVDNDEMATITDEIKTTKTALDDWLDIELREELHSAVSKLPEQYSQVIKLHYFEGKSYKEIGEKIDKPTSSVGTLLRRAKKRLLLIVLESKRFE